MSGKIILSIVLAFSSYAHADLKKKIEEANANVKQVGNTQSECTTCYNTSAGLGGDVASLMKSCVESICPAQDFSLSATYDKMIDRASKPDTKFDQEIAPLLSAIAKEDASEKTVRGNTQLEWLKNAKNLSEPGGIRTFNLFVSLNSFSKFQFKAENGKAVVDVEKSRALFPNLSDDDFRKRVQIGNKILDAFMNRAIPETDPARVQLFYPGDKFKERVNEVLSSFEEKGKKIASDPELNFLVNLNEFKEMASGEKLKSQFASSEQINPDLIQDLNQTNSLMDLFVSLSTDPEMKKLLDSPPIDIKKMATELRTEKLLRDRIEKQKSVLNGTNSAASSKCKVAFSMAQEGLPTQQQVDDFKKKVESIKGKFLGKTKGLMCSEAGRKYNDEVQGWIASLPLTRDQHMSNMKASLTRALEKSKNWKKQYNEIEKSPSRDTFYAVGIASLKEDYNESTSRADEVCKNLMPNILPDATAYFSKNFVAGPMVVEHEHAEGICHHELGHKLFHFMKYQNTCGDKSQFTKIRSCLLMNHSELTPEELLVESGKATFGGDSKYESEDWADLVSSMVDDKTNNFACLFARKMKNEDYATLSLRNSDSSDPHSSDLFRLLHLNFLKNGKIPTQCEHALSARGEKANFKNCLNP